MAIATITANEATTLASASVVMPVAARARLAASCSQAGASVRRRAASTAWNTRRPIDGVSSMPATSSSAIDRYPASGSADHAGSTTRTPARPTSSRPGSTPARDRRDGRACGKARRPAAIGSRRAARIGAALPASVAAMPSAKNSATPNGSSTKRGSMPGKYPPPRSAPKRAIAIAATPMPRATPAAAPIAPTASDSSSSMRVMRPRLAPSARSSAICGRRRTMESAWVEKTRNAPVNRATSASTFRLTR